jgi:hypothetical protein
MNHIMESPVDLISYTENWRQQGQSAPAGRQFSQRKPMNSARSNDSLNDS